MFVIRVLTVAVLAALPSLLPAQTLHLKAVNANPGRPSLFTLKMQLPQPLAPDAAIDIRFPGSYDIRGVKIAGSNDLAGGIRFQVDSVRVRLQRTGLGPVLGAGRSATIIFGPVGLPQKAGAIADSAEVQVFFEGAGNQNRRQAFRIPIR